MRAHQQLAEESQQLNKANTLEAKKQELINEIVADDMQRIF